MTMNPDTADDRDRRFDEQLAEVRRRHPDLPLEVEDRQGRAPDEPRYVYEADVLLAPPDALPWLRENNVEAEPRIDNGFGLSKMFVAEHPDETIPQISRRLNGSRRAGPPVVSPNHLVSIAPVNLCPAGEPQPVHPSTPIWPPGCPDPEAGRGVRVLVIDTGLLPGIAQAEGELLHGVEPAGGLNQLLPTTAAGCIPEYAGHGLFVTAVLRSAAPGVRVTLSNALQRAGALDEFALGVEILRAIGGGEWPQIICLAAGATTESNAALAGLAPFFAELDQHPETLLVAAAGNDGSGKPTFQPAASAPGNDGIVSVGALRHAVTARACFSNYGDWVKLFARGEDHVNLFPDGLYAYQHGAFDRCRYYPAPGLYEPCGCTTSPRYGEVVAFDRLARWSGTSFATPLVAGRIAALMTHSQRTSRKAAEHLIGSVATSAEHPEGTAFRALI